MKQRLLTGLGLIAVLILALAMRQVTLYIFDLFIGLIAFYSLMEMTKLLSKSGKYNNELVSYIYLVLSYTLLMVCIVFGAPLYMVLIYQVLLLALLFTVVFLIEIIFRKKSENEIKTRKLKIGINLFALKKALHTLYSLIYPTLLFMIFVFINHLSDVSLFNEITNIDNFAFFSLVLIFALPVLADTFAYLTGNLIGGKKLCEKLSPKKTISGAIGGVVWTMIGGVCIFLIFNAFNIYNNLFATLSIEFWHFIIVGFVSSIFCIAGDLFESYLKRKAEVKDSGDIFPGHGGFLDRLDSHLFNTVVILAYCLIVLI